MGLLRPLKETVVSGRVKNPKPERINSQIMLSCPKQYIMGKKWDQNLHLLLLSKMISILVTLKWELPKLIFFNIINGLALEFIQLYKRLY